MAIGSDSWWLFLFFALFMLKDKDMCHNGTKPNNRRDDATDECLRLAVRYMAEKEGQLIQQGRDGYASEIMATFRPSAAILLRAWEDLLDTIEDTDMDDNNKPNDYGK